VVSPPLLQVLYDILDWPTKPHSKLIVIGMSCPFTGGCKDNEERKTLMYYSSLCKYLGIANTMDLPEKLLPRISSRMGIQRLCFGPYNYQQLQEIILTRLRGIDAFEKQAIEFASRKVSSLILLIFPIL